MTRTRERARGTCVLLVPGSPAAQLMFGCALAACSLYRKGWCVRRVLPLRVISLLLTRCLTRHVRALTHQGVHPAGLTKVQNEELRAFIQVGYQLWGVHFAPAAFQFIVYSSMQNETYVIHKSQYYNVHSGIMEVHKGCSAVNGSLCC